MPTDLLSAGLSWLSTQQRASVSQTVTYSRAAQTKSLAATLANTEFVGEGADGVVLRWQSQDFLISAADLILGGSTTLPRTGDRITWGTEVYEVLPPDGGECFKRCDPAGVRLRIHTKRIT